MTITREIRPSDRMRRVNDSVWETLEPGGDDAPIAFFCECSIPDCFQPVWLTGTEYAERRMRPGWQALHAGHSAKGAEETDDTP